MIELEAAPAQTTAERQKAANGRTMLGFWTYLMTDCVLFASLFAVYAVLRGNTFGGPAGKEIFNMPSVLAETLILLTSSFTCGLAMVAVRRANKQQAFMWLVVTFALGCVFLALELSEFRHLVVEGNNWRRSGFLSSFFTLVGTHGLHITVGLLWMIVMLVQIARKGLAAATVRRLTLLSLFWHFLDVIWIFIFTIVYLIGAAA
ncbi:MAG TPA: cytochrome o ubiquinol oxidase subunit III [Candidatus Saccharimonadales bacterium]|jgi:cytochrome o ubiquinol oxidase subunit 3|nr:cytochrome o ubiquinol oxidase subunit III [Candidatus Saccharimonadales bacterium]